MVKAAEARLSRLQRERDALRLQLADPALYDGPADGIAALNQRAGAIDKEIAAAESAWLAAQEALDAAAG